MKTTTLTLLAAGALLAGCGGSGDPAPPPTSDDALTTSSPTSQAAPTTDEPPEDVIETSAPPDDVVETTQDSGPPELPEEAREDSEAGAEAFALHYIDLINYTSKYPEPGLLSAMTVESCDTCSNLEDTVVSSSEDGVVSRDDLFEVIHSVASHNPSDSEAIVRVQISQVAQDFVDPNGVVVDRVEDQDATAAFDMTWDDTWTIRDLRFEPGH